MTKLTKKKVKFSWSDACEGIFEELKDKLTLTQILTLLEGNDMLVFYYDTSWVGLGCVWMQHGKVIGYASKP